MPEWKWDSISLDFIDCLPRSRKGNTRIWVIVDRLTKSAYFIPIKSKHTASYLASLYVREIILCKDFLLALLVIEIPFSLVSFGEAYKRRWGHNIG